MIALQEDESRRLFVFRLLSVLAVHSQLSEDTALCSAVVTLAVSPCLSTRDPTGATAGSPPPPPHLAHSHTHPLKSQQED